MRLFLFAIMIMLAACSTPAQNKEEENTFYDDYPAYRDNRVEDRRFKHADVVAALGDLPPAFRQKRVGTSIEGRSIHLVSIGEGELDVLLWSQMHGDEPTATMAILDLFRFFAAADEYDGFRQKILQECTLHFIPMLNPDGAEKFQRRNALGIDLNRDALRLQTPEAQVLKKVRDSLAADWGFNLHDQSRYYSAGRGEPYTASISFLAPAYNDAKDINEKREDAMQLIGYMNRLLQQYIPNQVGKYDDTFEPRAFGDNIQKWGTRTILIETGGLAGDREKQELRRLNFTILLRAFDGIANGTFAQVPRLEYEELPYNRYNAFHDLIIRRTKYQLEGSDYILDIALRRDEVEYNDHADFYLRGRIVDLGDLSTSEAYQEVDGDGMRMVAGKVWPTPLSGPEALEELDLWEKVQDGYLYIPLATGVPQESQYHNLPIQVLPAGKYEGRQVELGQNPAFLLMKDEKPQYAIVNGQAFDLRIGKEAFEDQWKK